MNLVFVFKSSRTNKRKMQKVLSVTRSSGLFEKVSVSESLYPKNSIAIAQKVAHENDYIIAVGGDGTLNEVVNGVMLYHEEYPSQNLPTIGVLPLGTANDFVKSINHKRGIDELLALIKSKQYQQIDIGKLQCFDEDRVSKITHYFINIADVGFGAHVVHKTNSSNSLLGANFKYTKAILSTFLSYKPKQLTMRFDDKPEETNNVLSLIFANGKYFASGLGIAPHAQLSDGKLAITQVGNVSMFDFLLHIGTLKKGEKITHKEAKYFKATRIKVSSDDEDSAVEADGEFIGYLPLKVNVLPLAINFLMKT
jgi:YegS/Rv2252/BmrU family lipid kinase